MSELAYMVREDWAQRGTAMETQSAVIRDWLGDQPYLFAVTDVKKLERGERRADVEAARFIAPDSDSRKAVNIADLGGLKRDCGTLQHPVAVLHPLEEHDLELLRELIGEGKLTRVFVMVWSPRESVRLWLDSQGATDLHTGYRRPAPDGLMVAGAELMVAEQYNGLASGRGKDATVQILRAFAAGGFPLDEGAWLRAFFAAGGHFRHSDALVKFIREMNRGVKHRVRPRYLDEILAILRDRQAAEARGESWD